MMALSLPHFGAETVVVVILALYGVTMGLVMRRRRGRSRRRNRPCD
jgi:uncharacterized membrane protein